MTLPYNMPARLPCINTLIYQVWSALGAMCRAFDMKSAEEDTVAFNSTAHQNTTINKTSPNQEVQVQGGEGILLRYWCQLLIKLSFQ